MSSKKLQCLNSEEYVARGGVRCPYCNRTNIEGDCEVYTDVGMAWQDMSCIDCNAEWVDEYSLTGYSTDGEDDE
jgi:hypothetical protein